MKSNTFTPLSMVLLYSLLLFIAHYTLFYSFNWFTIAATFKYSVIYLYVLFTIASIVIITTLIMVKLKYFDVIGYAFMGLTSLKIGVLLYWAQPILKNINHNAKFEKSNFFIIFALFLVLETIVTTRLLKNK